MKTNVLFLIDSFEVLGGAEKNLIEVASSLDPDKFQPTICCLKPGKAYESLKAKGIQVINLQINRIYSFAAFLKAFKLIKYIKNNKVKVFITYLEGSDIWGSLIARMAGVPVVISSRRDMGFNLKSRHILAYRIINNLFDKIIAVSNAAKGEIVRREGVSPVKITTIYNGVELNTDVKADSRELKNSLGLDPHKRTVVMLSNLEPIKGHDNFLHAVSGIVKKYKDVQFLLVGEGKKEYKESLRKLAESLGVINDVIFAGFRSDVRDILPFCDVAVSSSNSEGFSNAILEYMAAGIPVVATDVGGNKELIVDGKNGILVKLLDAMALAAAIQKLLENRQFADSLAKEGRRLVEESFTKDKMVRKIEVLFARLLRDKRKEKLLRKAIKVLIANVLFYTGLIWLFKKIAARKNKLTIFTYHRVNNDSLELEGMSVGVEEFEAQMFHLKENYNPIPLEQAIDRIKRRELLPKNSVAVTFDDGYRDNYTNALPILKRNNIPATIFLTAGAIEEGKPLWFDVIADSFRFAKQKNLNNKYSSAEEAVSFAKGLRENERNNFINHLLSELQVKLEDIVSDNQMLSWEEVKKMKAEGIDFGSHGMSHTILTNLPENELAYEISASKRIIEERTGLSARHFAYPNGQSEDFNEKIAELLQKNNYESGLTLLKGSNNGNSKIFTLKRLNISQNSSQGIFKGFSSPLFDLEILGLFRLFKKRRV